MDIDPFAPIDASDTMQSHTAPMAPQEPDDWEPLPVPDDAPEPPKSFGKLGTWSRRYAYHSACGALVGYVLRFDLPTGKQTRPLRWGRLRGHVGWHLKGWSGDKARPLFRLLALLAEPEAPVLLCEGEKAAHAAAALLRPSWVVIASMNGAQSPQRSDWSLLAGRHLTIWPDNDGPGRTYAANAAALALKAGAASVRIVDLPEGLPEGWDLADPVPEGMDLDIAAMLAAAANFDADSEEQGKLRVQRRKAGRLEPGIYFQSKDPGSGKSAPEWDRFGSRLEVLGYTRDGESREWGRYLAIYDGDDKVHHIAMPMVERPFEKSARG